MTLISDGESSKYPELFDLLNNVISMTDMQNPLWHGTSGRNWIVAHAAIRKSDRLWSSIAFAGIKGDGLGELCEQRRCPACGSTLSRPITALDAVQVLSTIGQVHAQSLDAVFSAGDALRRLTQDEPPTSDS